MPPRRRRMPAIIGRVIVAQAGPIIARHPELRRIPESETDAPSPHGVARHLPSDDDTQSVGTCRLLRIQACGNEAI